MKRKLSVIFLFLALVISFSTISTKYVVKAKEVDELLIKSKSAYLIEPYTRTVIYKNNETERLPIASMCKIMTLLLCFEALDSNQITTDEIVTISQNAAGMGGSQVFLDEGGEYIIGELIKSIVVASANDACVAMAEKLCGSEYQFVDKMNEKAISLGMDNTVFVNCTGLPKPGQYSCAKDVATMFCELIKHSTYFRFSKIWTDKIAHPNDRFTEISNTNKLIRFYEGCDGGKTGYTSEAGHCLSASAMRNGMRLVSVIISAPDSKTRFKESSDMFNYGFNNYVNKLVIDNNKPLEISVSVEKGKKDSVEVIAESPVYLFSKKNEKRNIEVNFVPNERIKAPILKGEVLGKLYIYENSKEIEVVNVISNEDVLCRTYFDELTNIIGNWQLI